MATPGCVTPAEASAHHGAGRPRQLAVALDVLVPRRSGTLRFGGPVLDAVLTRSARRLP